MAYTDSLLLKIIGIGLYYRPSVGLWPRSEGVSIGRFRKVQEKNEILGTGFKLNSFFSFPYRASISFNTFDFGSGPDVNGHCG